MRSAKLYRYHYPWIAEVILREEKLTVREGFVVELREDGKVGSGKLRP